MTTTSGDVCPSVAWIAHGDLDRAVETLDLALAALERAAGHTDESVREAWSRRRVTSTRVLLEHFLAEAASGVEPDVDGEHA